MKQAAVSLTEMLRASRKSARTGGLSSLTRHTRQVLKCSAHICRRGARAGRRGGSGGQLLGMAGSAFLQRAERSGSLLQRKPSF